MYISEATRDAMCKAGAWGIGIVIGGMLLAVAMPWIIRKLKIASLRLGIVLCDVAVWGVRTHCRHRNARLTKRDERRYHNAMKVFENPVRWEETR